MCRFYPAALLALLTLAGCDGGLGAGESGGRKPALGATLHPLYVREYVFLGLQNGQPLVAPFVFRSTMGTEGIRRVARASIGRGGTWESIFEERWESSNTGGVWRILPRGDLKVAALGASEVEAIWYERGDRTLRLQVGKPLSGWAQGTDARFRVFQGRLTLGQESTLGAVLQLLRIERASATRDDSKPTEWIFLSGGDSVRLVLARVSGDRDRFGTSFGWIGRAGGEQVWEMVEVVATEMQPLPDAKDDIPLRWQFRIPEAGVHGEVRSLGYDADVGTDRGEQYALDVHYSVEGWVEVDGQRREIMGTVRHTRR